MTRMEEYTPTQTPMHPVPVHDLWSAMGIDATAGELIDPEKQQAEKLVQMFGTTHLEASQLPKFWADLDQLSDSPGDDDETVK
jgi:hypothetical protein